VLGHAFGNQHVPVEFDGSEARIPVTTSERIARETVEGLALEGVSVTVEEVALGSDRPVAVGHAHADDHHGHSHGP
jgi:urease accessory protein